MAGDVFCEYNDDYGAGTTSGFDCALYDAGEYSIILSGCSSGTGDYALNLTECGGTSVCGDGRDIVRGYLPCRVDNLPDGITGTVTQIVGGAAAAIQK